MTKATGSTLKHMGIIPFGSTDEAVLFQDPLTSEPTEGAMIGTGATFDSDGMNTNDTGAWKFDLNAIGADYQSLINSCQVSFDVSGEALGRPYDPDNDGSTGVVPTEPNDYLLSWSDDGASGSTFAGRLQMSSANFLAFQFEWGDTTLKNDLRLSNHVANELFTGFKEKLTVTLSICGSEISIYIDGVPFWKQKDVEVRSFTDILRWWSIGTYEGRGSSGYVASAGKLFKNFIIANRPVMLATHPGLAKVAAMGDSFGVDMAESATAGYQIKESYTIKGYLAKKGLRIGCDNTDFPCTMLNVASNGGVIDDNNGVSWIDDQVAGLLVEKPTKVICYGGINDSRDANYVAATFESKYKDTIDKVLVDGGGVHDMYLMTVISGKGDGAVYTGALGIPARTAEINAIINSLPAWWDANNVGREGMLHVIDLFAALGGEDINPYAVLGLWDADAADYLDNIHLASFGQSVSGQMMGAALYQDLK